MWHRVCFGLIVGVIAGFVLNYIWYLFHALVLGWKDSAPEWYFPIRGTVRLMILIGMVVVFLADSPVMYGWRKWRGRV